MRRRWRRPESPPQIGSHPRRGQGFGPLASGVIQVVVAGWWCAAARFGLARRRPRQHVIAFGTPDTFATVLESPTGRYLR